MAEEGDFVEEWMSIIMYAIYQESRAIGDEIEMDLIERLSVPVEVVDDLGGRGSHVVRSKRGEYPRMETGELRDSIGNLVLMDGDGPDTVIINVYTTDPKALVLEGEMGRKLIGETAKRWEPIVEERFAGLTF